MSKTPINPKRLTYKAVNKALQGRPGWAGEELVRGEGYLYFTEGKADQWHDGCSIPVCYLSHTTLESILEDFDNFVKAHAA